MAEVNSTDHLVRPEKESLSNGHDNEGYHAPRAADDAPNGHPLNGHHMEEAVIGFSPVRHKGGGESIPLEPLPEKKNGGWEEKPLNNGKGLDDVSLAASNHRKCLSREDSISSCSEHKTTGEKLYFTEESRKICPGWRRLLICGLILIMIAIALLLGVLAATGILLSKSDSKNTRYESGHSFPNMDSVAHAGHSFRPRPSKVPQKFQPPVTVEHSTVPVTTAPSTVTSKVPSLLNDSSHSQTIVPNALVGEFKIIDENFTEDLNDPSSSGYRTLAENLERELRRIFIENKGEFDQIKVLNFRPGSIRVKFVVIWSSDEGIISSEKASEILSADLRRKNNSFYNFFYVDMNSIHCINVFDECRVQKGGCSFDCMWNYDTLQKTCLCPMNMHLLADGKSCALKPQTSSTSTSTSPQTEPFSPMVSTSSTSETTPKTSWSSQETRPLVTAEVNTTPEPTEFSATDVTITDHFTGTHLEPELTTTERPTSNVQTFPTEFVDRETTTRIPRGELGTENVRVFSETATEETTLAGATVATPSYTTKESVQDTTYSPSTYREETIPVTTESFPTDAKETVNPHYETTELSSQASNFRTEDQRGDPPTSTLKYHVPEPTTEVYTWTPPHHTEPFNPTVADTTYPTDYTTWRDTTHPVTTGAEVIATETTVEMVTEPAVTTTSSIKREGTWQEGETTPTTHDGGVLNGQTDTTTVVSETTYFTEGRDQATFESTTSSQDLTTLPNSTFPFSLPAFNRTPAVRSYDNFTDFYDNSTYVEYNGTETMVAETSTDSGTTGYFTGSSPSYSTYWSTPEATNQFNTTDAENVGLFHESRETSTTGYSSTSTNRFTIQESVFNATENAASGVTDQTTNPTFQTDGNTNFPSIAVTEPHPTEIPMNFSGLNFTSESNAPDYFSTEASLGNLTTFTVENMNETYNPTFPTETTSQFPSTLVTETYYPNTETSLGDPETTETTGTTPHFNITGEVILDETKPFGSNDSDTTFSPMTRPTDGDGTVASTLYDSTETVSPFMSHNTTSGIFEVGIETTTYPSVKVTINDQSETTVETSPNLTVTGMDNTDTTPVSFLEDTITTESPFTSEISTSPDPQNSAKNETESTSFPGSEGFTTDRIHETQPPVTYPRETTSNFQTETVTAEYTTPFQVFPIPEPRENETAAGPSTEQPSTFLTETNYTEVTLSEWTTTPLPYSNFPTTLSAETLTPIFPRNDSDANLEVDTTTLPTGTLQPMEFSSEKSTTTNESIAVTEQSTLVTSKVSFSSDISNNTETTMSTDAQTDLSSFNSNSSTIVPSVTLSNDTFHNESAETTIAYSETTFPTITFPNASEPGSTIELNSTLSFTTLPTINEESNITDITSYPYNLNESTTIAPYTFEDTTMPDYELNSEPVSSTFSPENTTDFNSTFINATTPGYMLNETTTNVSVGIICRDDQFICEPLNVCLNSTFQCDGIQDCPDGIDELDCQDSCRSNFKCSNSSSMCIMSEAHCDGIWDCENGTDEEFCKPTECAKHEVMCSDQSKCIRASDICDLKYDCKDRSDELGCLERTTCESGGKFFCNDGLCIPWSLKCDGEYDCKDKEDEGNCTCPNDEFRCNDGKCLKSSSRCDGHKDCHDGGDEMECVKVDTQHLVMTYEPYSGTWAMLCAEDWTLDDGHYLCQELGFGHALQTEKQHVSFNGTWMAMRRENLTDASLWTERVSFVESCTSSLAASVECQKFACGEYTGILHRRRRRDVLGSSSSSQVPFVGYTSTFYSSKGCLSEILTPIWLITSADCLMSISRQPFNGSDWYVRTNIGRSMEVTQIHEVLRIVSHSQSSKFRSLMVRDYDVALIRLKHALVFVSDRIGAICPPEEQVPTGITCFSGVLGMQAPRAPPPSTLAVNTLALQILDRKNCNTVDHYNDLINRRMLCTQSSEGHTICDNDEGTPLMCLSGINKWYLAGMLSYQRYCDVYNKHPAVFSNLFSMRNFIDQVTGQKQYEIPYQSQVYVIIPPTTPSPAVPETTTVMYDTSTYMSDFTTLVGEYGTTLNATVYDDENASLYENTSSTTSGTDMYDETTLPTDEFIEMGRGEENLTTPAPFMTDSDNSTEWYTGTTFMPNETVSLSWNSTALELSTLDNSTTATPSEFTNTTVPMGDIVTLEGEVTTLSPDNSTMESIMFESAYETHVSGNDSESNITHTGHSFASYILHDNNTERFNSTTLREDVFVTTPTHPDATGILTSTESDSMSNLTSISVLSMGNETVDSVIGPEKLTLVTTTEPHNETSSDGDAHPTTFDAKYLTPTGRPFWRKETYIKELSVEADNRMNNFTEIPPVYKEDSTLNYQFNETLATAYTESPNKETTTMQTPATESFTEPILRMENRAESFELLRETTTSGTFPTDYSVKETSPKDFSIADTTILFDSKSTTPSYTAIDETATESGTFHSDRTVSSLSKDTILTEETETSFRSATPTETTETSFQSTSPTETSFQSSTATETTPKPVSEHDGLTLIPEREVVITTQAPQTTTPSSETGTLMLETEVGTEGDIAILAFNDSDGIVVQPADTNTRGNFTDYLFRGRSFDQPSNSSDIRYDTTPTVKSYTEYSTTPLVPETTAPTTEWEEYYSTLTTPGGVDGMQDATVTEGTRVDTITNPATVIVDTETTTVNPQTDMTSTGATSVIDDSSTDSSTRDIGVSRQIEHFEKCGEWKIPSNLTHPNNTKFYEEWPALGYLQLIRETKLCAASMLSPYLLITSLNCLSVRDSTLDGKKWAYVGGLYHPDPLIEVQQQTHLVAEIVPFENITRSLLFRENNVALVRLKHPVILNRFAQKVCLPQGGEVTTCYTAGWAEKGENMFISSPVKILSHEECNSTRNYNGLIKESLTCTDHGSFPRCLLGSGSPLFCLQNDHWELRGVLANSNSCDLIQPAVYHSISTIQEWIKELIIRY